MLTFYPIRETTIHIDLSLSILFIYQFSVTCYGVLSKGLLLEGKMKLNEKPKGLYTYQGN